ncbi:MAG: RodZ domain-containing protein [Pseudomonadota bacterium]
MRNTQVSHDYDERNENHVDTSDDFDTFSFDDIKDRDDIGERDGYNTFGRDDKDTPSDNYSSSSIFGDSGTHTDTSIRNLLNDTKKSNYSVGAVMSIGARLRKERELKNMSVQQVAEMLFIDVQMVEKLEANNYDELPPPLFVRGYMRNYAKLLDIPQESILEDFNRMNLGQVQASTPPPTEKNEETVTSLHDLWPKIGIVVIVILMALFALWIFYPNTNSENADQPMVENPQQDPNDLSLVHPPSDIQPTIQTVEEQQQVEEPITPSEPVVTAPVMTEEPVAEAADQTTPAPEEPTVVTPTKQTLHVHAKEDAWMKITDSSGKKLFYGIAKAGKVLDLEGKPPFYLRTVRLVEIEYQGEINKMTSYPKTRLDGTKVFVIGSDEQQN